MENEKSKKKDKWTKKKKLIFFSSFAFIFFFLGAMYIIADDNFSYQEYVNKIFTDKGFSSASTNLNWSKKAELTINSSLVEANLTNFPVLITNANLPAEIWNTASAYHALSTGCDIRFTTDSAGTNEVPFEITSWDLDESDGSEIWVKLNVSNETDTTFWIWYNNSDASCYADDATYGAENVWSDNYGMVQHLNDLTTSTTKDSTSNDNNGAKLSANNPLQTTNGKIGSAQVFSSDYINLADDDSLKPQAHTMSAWINTSAPTTNFQMIMGSKTYDYYDLRFEGTTGKVQKLVETNAQYDISSDSAIVANTWNYVSATWDPAESTPNIKLYINGVLQADTGYTANAIATEYIDQIGARRNALTFVGLIDEVRVSGSARSAGWIKTEYNNQNNNTQFVSAGDGEPTEIEDVLVVIDYPIGLTNYETEITTLNYTATNYTNPGDSCWYSINDGVTNSSAVEFGTNFTGISDAQGERTWTVYCNDTSGSEHSDHVTFNVNYIPISLTTNYPINGTTYYTNVTEFNYTAVNNSVIGDSCWYSIDGGVTNSTAVEFGTNFTGISDIEGDRTWTVFCNSTNGDINSSTVDFTTDIRGTWFKQVELTINHSLVDEDLNDFPVLITNENLPSQMWNSSSDYSVDPTGCSIRFSTDIDRENQVPFEIVNWTLDSPTGSEIWVKLNLSSTVDTIFYIWYYDAEMSCYDTDDTYGSENVWNNNFRMVQHLEDFTTSIVNDSTSNNNDGAKQSADNPEQAEGKISFGQNFTNDYILASNTDDGFVTSGFTTSAWIKTSGDGVNNVYSRQDGDGTGRPLLYSYDENGLGTTLGGSSHFSNVVVDDGAWHYVTIDYFDGNVKLYVDGEQVLNETATEENATGSYVIGAKQTADASWFVGIIDDLKLSNTSRGESWIKTEYNNQNDTTKFFINSGENIIVDTKYPLEDIYRTQITELSYNVVNYTNPGDSCWYSVNGGTTNSSAVSFGTNFTGLASTDGWNTWTVYCNDTEGYTESDSISFYYLISYDTFYVRNSNDTYGSGDGSSYENAFSGWDNANWNLIGYGDTIYDCSGERYVLDDKPYINLTINGNCPYENITLTGEKKINMSELENVWGDMYKLNITPNNVDNYSSYGPENPELNEIWFKDSFYRQPQDPYTHYGEAYKWNGEEWRFTDFYAEPHLLYINGERQYPNILDLGQPSSVTDVRLDDTQLNGYPTDYWVNYTVAIKSQEYRWELRRIKSSDSGYIRYEGLKSSIAAELEAYIIGWGAINSFVNDSQEYDWHYDGDQSLYINLSNLNDNITYTEGGAGIILNNCSGINIANYNITRTNDAGIMVFKSENIIVENNTITDIWANSYSESGGAIVALGGDPLLTQLITEYTSNITIRNNDISNVHQGNGIWVGYYNNTYIDDNIISNIGNDTRKTSEQSGIYFLDGSHGSVSRNKIDYIPYNAIHFWYGNHFIVEGNLAWHTMNEFSDGGALYFAGPGNVDSQLKQNDFNVIRYNYVEYTEDRPASRGLYYDNDAANNIAYGNTFYAISGLTPDSEWNWAVYEHNSGNSGTDNNSFINNTLYDNDCGFYYMGGDPRTPGPNVNLTGETYGNVRYLETDYWIARDPAVLLEWDDENSSIQKVSNTSTYICANTTSATTCNLYFNGTEYINETSSELNCWNITDLENGNYTEVYATCNAGTQTINSSISWLWVGDLVPPEIIQLNQTNSSGTINGSVTQDENATFTVNVTDNEEVDSVWVTIWQGVIGGPIWLIQQLIDLGSGIWEGNVTINNSLGSGDVNYTIYVNDTFGNEANESSNFTFISTDTCTCPGLDTNWEVNMADYCVLSEACDLGTGTISFVGEGNFTCNARLDTTGMGDPGAGAVFWFNSGCEVYVDG